MANPRLLQNSSSWDQLSDGVFLLGLVTTIVCFGGRHPWGYAGLVAGSLVAAGAIVTRQILYDRGKLRRTGAEGLLLLGVGIPLIQLIPLPEAWLSALSPQLSHILPAWNEGVTATLLGRWQCLSVAPEETRIALSLWLAYSLIFFYTVQRIGDVDDVERILHWLVPIVVVLSILGLLQYLFSNNKFFWLYPHPFAKTNDAVKACFTNRNHFAEFVALTAGPLLWWCLAKNRSQRTHQYGTATSFDEPSRLGNRGLGYLKWLALPIVLLALLLTQSRGGILAATISLVVAGIALYQTGVLKKSWMGTFALGMAFLVAAVLVVGTDTIFRRWEAVAQLSWDQIDRGEARRSVWQNTWRAAQDFLVTGSGCGSFSAVYPLYQTTRSSRLYYTHAENGYLQVLLETGLPGVVLLTLACGTLIVWTWRAWKFAPSNRHRSASGVIAGGLLAFASHGLVDYVWYVPALAAVVAILVGCLARLNQMARSEAQETAVPEKASHHSGRCRYVIPWPIPTMTILLCAMWEVPAVQRALSSGLAEFSWHQYLRLYRTAEWSDTWQSEEVAASSDDSSHSKKGSETVDEISNAAPRVADDPATSETDSDEEVSTLFAKEQKMVALLATVIRHDPSRAEARLRLAKAYLRLFDLVQRRSPNSMPLSQIRDAVMVSSFASQDELDRWLHIAIGDHVKLLQRARQEALTAVRLCPLLGEGYFILGQVSFLNGGREEDVVAWFRQALSVRPNDGELLFRVGAEFALMGWHDEAMSLWQRAFRCGRLYQYRLLERLIGCVPPDQVNQEITFLLETFEPDLEILRYMYRQYRKRYSPECLEPLRQAYALALTSQLRDDHPTPSQRAELWLELHFLYLDSGAPEEALQCAQQAVRCDPLDYRAHHYLSLRLEEMGRFAEAEEHVRWCLQRRPGHRALRNRLHNLYQKRMKAEDEERTWRMAESIPATGPQTNR